jgi:hypothetical protein
MKISNLLWNVVITSNTVLRTPDIPNVTLYRLELITNLMHNFIYSIITLHRDPQHVSSIAVLIFKRTICIFAVSGIVTLCMLPSSAPIKSGLQRRLQSVTIPHTVYIYKLSSWRWAQRCSKHVEEQDVMLLQINKILHQVGDQFKSTLWCTVRKPSNYVTLYVT